MSEKGLTSPTEKLANKVMNKSDKRVNRCFKS